MEKNRLYSIFLKHWKEKRQGFFQIENKEWILLKEIFSDYIIDGEILIQKKHICNIERGDKEELKEHIIIVNNKLNTDSSLLNNLSVLFEYLYIKKTIIEIRLDKEFLSYVGKIIKVNKKSIVLKLLNSQGIWLENENFNIKKDKIRSIEYNTDYINSLLTYSETLNNYESVIL